MSCSIADSPGAKNYHVTCVGHVDAEFWSRSHLPADREGCTEAQVCSVSQSRTGVMAEGTQTSLPLQGLLLSQVQSHHRASASHGRSGGAEATTGRWRCRCARPAGLHQRLTADTAAWTSLGSRHRVSTRGQPIFTRPPTDTRPILVFYRYSAYLFFIFFIRVGDGGAGHMPPYFPQISCKIRALC